MPDTMKMPFGKYGPRQNGGASDMEDVPAEYLYWLSQQPGLEKWPAVKKYIDDNMNGIKKELGLDKEPEGI